MALLCHTHSQRATATALLCHTHRQRAPATALLCHTHSQRDTDCRGIYFACTSQLRCVYALPTRSCRQSDHKRPPYCCALHFVCLQTQIDKHHGIHHDGESQNKKRFWQKNHTLHDGALSSPKGKATRGGESSPGAPNTTFETSQKE